MMKGEYYLFWVGFGMLGGILLRLAATTCSCVDLGPSLPKSEYDGDIFETKGEGGRVLVAWDICESINVMAKITAIIKLDKDFMVFADLEDVFYLLYASCNDKCGHI